MIPRSLTWPHKENRKEQVELPPIQVPLLLQHLKTQVKLMLIYIIKQIIYMKLS